MLRFTIRELVLITLIVAILLGWWVDRSIRFSAIEREKHFWKWTAIKLQGLLEEDGYEVEVTDRAIQIEAKGVIRGTMGETGREAAGFRSGERWPTSEELSGRPDPRP